MVEEPTLFSGWDLEFRWYHGRLYCWVFTYQALALTKPLVSDALFAGGFEINEEMARVLAETALKQGMKVK